jgi:cytidylate kinase
MAKSKAKRLPHFKSLDKLIKFFETKDMGEYWNEMPEAHFEVDIKKRTHLFSLDAELESRLTEIAKLKHISSKKLINAWLKEKLQEQMKRVKDRQSTAA